MMEKLKMSIGFILLPFAFAIWVIDRMVYSLMPKYDHKNFSEWINTSTVIFATVRVILIFVFRWVVYWIFGI